jgi:hypothetical protein
VITCSQGDFVAVDDKIDRLSQELGKQSLGPVDAVSDEVMGRLGWASGSFVAWLRQAAYDQPLMTLLLACQVGYVAARLGRAYALR